MAKSIDKIDIIVGARPNFMKAAPLIHAQASRFRLVHTGQHFDYNMSDVFFQDLKLPAPDVFLGCSGGSQAQAVAAIMVRYEEEVLRMRPRAVLVVGDVNSTLAAALVAAKLQLPLVHLEAGLRSGDRTMPEEINRLVTDRLANALLTPSADADENLRNEGVSPEAIFRVGNIMIDAVRTMLAQISPGDEQAIRKAHGIDGKYILLTLHRPANVDDPRRLAQILRAVAELAGEAKIIFPVHPRTRQQLAALPEGATLPGKVTALEPLRYRDFIVLEKHATVVVTDSGGVQEETTFLGTPCITVRDTTERPITVSEGTNVLVGAEFERIAPLVKTAFQGAWKRGRIPELWDGHTAGRVINVLDTLRL